MALHAPAEVARCDRARPCNKAVDVSRRTLRSPSEGLSLRPVMLSGPERRFLAHQRIARLATADRRAVPHVVPVCFAIAGSSLYVAIDEKPKRGPVTGLKRLRNIAENPTVAVVVDRYEEDWPRLGFRLLPRPAHIPPRRQPP